MLIDIAVNQNFCVRVIMKTAIIIAIVRNFYEFKSKNFIKKRIV